MENAHNILCQLHIHIWGNWIRFSGSQYLWRQCRACYIYGAGKLNCDEHPVTFWQGPASDPIMWKRIREWIEADNRHSLEKELKNEVREE